MRADPAAALRLWLGRNGVSEATVRVSARSRDRYAARVGPSSAHDTIRAAARETQAVEVRNDGMVVFNPRSLFEELGLTADRLGDCDNADCDRGADRFVCFPASDAVREYCSGHAARAERLTEA